VTGRVGLKCWLFLAVSSDCFLLAVIAGYAAGFSARFQMLESLLAVFE